MPNLVSMMTSQLASSKRSPLSFELLKGYRIATKMDRDLLLGVWEPMLTSQIGS